MNMVCEGGIGSEDEEVKIPLCDQVGDLCPVYLGIIERQRTKETNRGTFIHTVLEDLAKLGLVSQNLLRSCEFRDFECLRGAGWCRRGSWKWGFHFLKNGSEFCYVAVNGKREAMVIRIRANDDPQSRARPKHSELVNHDSRRVDHKCETLIHNYNARRHLL